MALFLQSIASFVMAEWVCTSLIFTSSTDVPSLVCVDPRCLNWSTSWNTFHVSIGGWPYLDAVDEDFAFAGSDFHSIYCRCVLQSFSNFLCCRLEDRCHQRITFCTEVAFRWILRLCPALSFPGIYYTVLEIMNTLAVLLLSLKKCSIFVSYHCAGHFSMQWPYPGCRCCILSRLARGHCVRSDAFCGRWNCERAPKRVL